MSSKNRWLQIISKKSLNSKVSVIRPSLHTCPDDPLTFPLMLHRHFSHFHVLRSRSRHSWQRMETTYICLRSHLLQMKEHCADSPFNHMIIPFCCFLHIRGFSNTVLFQKRSSSQNCHPQEHHGLKTFRSCWNLKKLLRSEMWKCPLRGSVLKCSGTLLKINALKGVFKCSPKSL